MALKPPTVAEKEWMDAICRIGCCVCIRESLGATPGEVHHMLNEAQRKLGHLLTLCLCYSHHRADLNNAWIVSRHRWRTEFEKRYGTEQELLAWTQTQVAIQKARQV